MTGATYSIHAFRRSPRSGGVPPAKVSANHEQPQRFAEGHGDDRSGDPGNHQLAGDRLQGYGTMPIPCRWRPWSASY